MNDNDIEIIDVDTNNNSESNNNINNELNNNVMDVSNNNVIDESNNVNNKPKKSKKKSILIILLLVIIAAGAFVYLEKDVLFGKSNNTSENNNSTENNAINNTNLNENNNTSTNENNNHQQTDNKKKELTATEKKEILDIIGMTEKGHKRIESGMGYDAKYTNGDYISYDSFGIANYLISSDAGSHVINDKIGDNIEGFLYTIFPSDGMKEDETVKKDKNNPCYNEYSQICYNISEAQFKEITKKYNIDSSKGTSLRRYNGYYIIPSGGGIGVNLKVSDSLSFSYDNNDVIVTYDIYGKIDPEEGSYTINKRLVCRFKTYDDGSYYLNNYVVTNL